MELTSDCDVKAFFGQRSKIYPLGQTFCVLSDSHYGCAETVVRVVDEMVRATSAHHTIGNWSSDELREVRDYISRLVTVGGSFSHAANHDTFTGIYPQEFTYAHILKILIGNVRAVFGSVSRARNKGFRNPDQSDYRMMNLRLTITEAKLDPSYFARCVLSTLPKNQLVADAPHDVAITRLWDECESESVPRVPGSADLIAWSNGTVPSVS